MKTREFSFNLPEELIAQVPLANRGTSRLMVIDPQNTTITHGDFNDFLNLVEPGTVIVFNNSKVRKARVFGKTKTGGSIELLFLENSHNDGIWTCLINKSKKISLDQEIILPGNTIGKVKDSEGNIRKIQFTPAIDEVYLEANGNIPLPPYIKRQANDSDSNRYQNIYAQTVGSAAAPTAGLHFTQQMIAALQAKNISIVYITLHVGLGTFLPVRSEEITDHKMHKENFFLSKESADLLKNAKINGRKILAVGTTSVRTLESAWDGNDFLFGWQDTDIFIHPGYQFKAVDQILTNFHTPESTLLMLVSAFAGWDFIKKSYEEAIEKRYRFFSYGDAMFISCRQLKQ